MPENQNNYVKTKSPSYIAYEDKWKKIRAVITSEVKDYLRDVGANESNPTASVARQKAYTDGAIFYNFTKRTVDGMVGSVYRKDPEIELPDELDYLPDNADGNGQGLIQQSQGTVRECTEMGRVGLFVDMPPQPIDKEGNPRQVTRKEQNEGMANPRIQMYKTESIINWRTERVGSVNKVVMVVLVETFEYQDGVNEFGWLTGLQYRVLDILDGEYRQRIWRFNSIGRELGATPNQTSYDEFFPKANGKPVREIPFVFVGADNSDFEIDEPPMYPMAEVNIGHYRNYADNEEMLFVVAQAMLVIAPGENMTIDAWAKANPDGVKFGSRSGLNVGTGGNAQLLQANSVSALSEAIKSKEDQAVAIGAQLITPTQQVTAEAARIQRGADTSVLASIANNVSDGYMKAIGWCMDFLGIDGDYEFSLNTDFFLQSMTSQDRQAWAADINAGFLPATEYKKALRRAGIVESTDEELDKDIELEGGMMGGIPEGPLASEMTAPTEQVATQPTSQVQPTVEQPAVMSGGVQSGTMPIEEMKGGEPVEVPNTPLQQGVFILTPSQLSELTEILQGQDDPTDPGHDVLDTIDSMNDIIAAIRQAEREGNLTVLNAVNDLIQASRGED